MKYNVPDDESVLSAREMKVLSCLANGMTIASTATFFRLSYNTIDTYTRRIYRKLGVHSRAEAVAWFCRHHSPLA